MLINTHLARPYKYELNKLKDKKFYSNCSSCDAGERVRKALEDFRSLPERHRELVTDFEDNCRMVVECIDKNYAVIKLFLEDVNEMFENASSSSSEANEVGFHLINNKFRNVD